MTKSSQSQDQQLIDQIRNRALPFAVKKGWIAMPNAVYTVYLKHPEMNTTALAVYGYLLRLYNAEIGYSFPTLPDIAVGLGVSVTTVQTSITKLRKVGLIVSKYNVRYNNNTYTFPPVVETMEELEVRFPEIKPHLEKLDRQAERIRKKAEDDKQRLRDKRAQ